ncbi:MAG: DNA-binding transcriptional regulator AsnC [Candidatus Izimaplasma bacterium HR2]|nr:MAG: DNA-binding transcriptional regulator AsnC [Candidatus Izimaplasma bacterium HR2]
MDKNNIYDNIDYEIIKILKNDARTPYSKIASELSLDVRNATKRIEKLINSEAIRLTAIISPSKFNYESIVDINISVEQSLVNETIDKLGFIPNISYIAKGWGSVNITLQARFKNNREMHFFIDDYLPKMNGVIVDSYILVPQIIHDIDSWMPNGEDFKG